MKHEARGAVCLADAAAFLGEPPTGAISKRPERQVPRDVVTPTGLEKVLESDVGAKRGVMVSSFHPYFLHPEWGHLFAKRPLAGTLPYPHS